MAYEASRGKGGVLLILLALAGILLSAISLYNHTQITFGFSHGPSFCNINTTINCDAVNKSPWSVLFGIPLAAWGLAFYLILLALSVLRCLDRLGESPRGERIFFVLGVWSALFSLYLFFVSELLIGAICILCVGMYLVNLLLLFTTVRMVRSEGIVSAFSGGVGELFALPRQACGVVRGGVSPRGVRRFLLLICVCVAVAFYAQTVLVKWLIASTRATHHLLSPEEAVVAWRKTPRLPLEARSGGALIQDWVKGPADAPIEITEFSDFECPACRAFYQVLEEIMAKYPGKIRFVFRNYPLDRSCNPAMTMDLHRHACLAATAARCAGEQDRFWEAVHYLFTVDAFNREASAAERTTAIENTAHEVGVDTAAFSECLSSSRHGAALRRDIEEGGRFGVEGTPSLFINKRKMPAADYQGLLAIIEAALTEK